MGPQGETGSLVQASETVLGAIKIGPPGQSITDGGSVNAGQIFCRLETHQSIEVIILISLNSDGIT